MVSADAHAAPDGIEQCDLRAILGENAMALWDFDVTAMREAADRTGPSVADLSTSLDLADTPKTFSWSLAHPVPLSGG